MSRIYAAKNSTVTKRELEHTELSRRTAGECIVLLENDGALPLRSTGKVALYGSGARLTVKGGTGSGEVNSRSSVSIEQGLENAGFAITTKAWLRRHDEQYARAREAYRKQIAALMEREGISESFAVFYQLFQVPAPADISAEDVAASDTDTAVYVISRTSGEGSDRFCKRGDYLLYEEEKAQLERLATAYDKLIVVLNVGCVMDLSELKAIPGVNAVVLMSQLGAAGGDALADVLTGKVNPSGKLTDTWAKRYEDYPSSATFSHNDGDVDDEAYTEGVYVGYRYFDTFHAEPLYPFGYGKSYTTFAVAPESAAVEGEIVRLSVSVRNTGAYAGKEVVQVYCSAPNGTIPKPWQELICFAKTKLLTPGEAESVELTFPARDLASYCEDCAAWVLEAGEYVLRVGSSSRGTVPAAVLTLDRKVRTEQLKKLFADVDGVREITAPMTKRAAVDVSVPRVALYADVIETRQAVYQEGREPYTTAQTKTLTLEDVRQGVCTVEELTAQLTVEEMATLCVGTLRLGEGSAVGNASYLVPGAAGDTSAILEQSRGIRPLILADGPAGLRLQPIFKTDKAGRLLPGGEVVEGKGKPFDPEYTDENTDTYYQYCTAIPVGWALAQSWNTALLEEIGSMVGTEMELFGVDLWLAPALNIHRNPLCGRNFEYYSEDPVVSGRAAAAITRGVQRHAGKGTTIKHFAANSQEDNRYFSNAHISERAIREIYIKGFELAVKESHPKSIMTSYNLLNGIHTANSYDLLQAVARDEWGYQGIIMTDWFTSQEQPEQVGKHTDRYPISASTGCVYAGNDIQMPGCQKNVDDIIEAATTGREIDGYRVTLADLQHCAANVIRATLENTWIDRRTV